MNRDERVWCEREEALFTCRFIPVYKRRLVHAKVGSEWARDHLIPLPRLTNGT